MTERGERLPHLLVELALADATDEQFANEGFTTWEVRAARAIVRRATEHSSSRVAPSADTRARVLTDAGP